MKSKTLFYRVTCLFLVLVMFISPSVSAFGQSGSRAENSGIPAGYVWRSFTLASGDFPEDALREPQAESARLAEKTEAIQEIWTLLLSRPVEVSQEAALTLTVQGWLPPDVTARAELRAYEETAHQEQALLHAELRLYDGAGRLWEPDVPVTVLVSGPAVEALRAAGMEPRVYLYQETQAEAETQEPQAEALTLEEPKRTFSVAALRETQAEAALETYRVEGETARLEVREQALSQDEAAPEAVCFTVQAGQTRFALTGLWPERVAAAQTLDETGSLAVTGRLPAQVSARMVAEAPPKGVLSEEALLAWTLKLVLEDGIWQPDGTLRVTVEDVFLARLADPEMDLRLWRLEPGEAPALVTDAAFREEGLTFTTERFGTFVVTQSPAERRLTAGDENNCQVQLTCDTRSGVPEEAALQVQELQPGEGLYERGLAAAAAALDKAPEQLAYVRVFDIALRDPVTGTEYQPTKAVRVRIQLPKEVREDYGRFTVVHIHGEGEAAVAEVLGTVGTGEVLDFSTDSFSVYVVIGQDPIPRRTYYFNIWKDDTWTPYLFTTDTGEETYEQTVRPGQRPVVPNPKASETDLPQDYEGEFAGWYAFQEHSSTEFEAEPYDFNTPITEDEVVNLYAVFKTYFYVIFHDEYSEETGTFPVASTRRGEILNGKTTIRISDVTTTYSGGHHMGFWGWSATPITVPGAALDDEGNAVVTIIAKEIEITAETHLYPIFKEIKWLSFWSGPAGSGATYYPAMRCFNGEGPSSLGVPVREGYTFLGWYAGSYDEATEEVTYGGTPLSNADGSLINNAADGGMAVYDGKLHLDDDATLYALWEGVESTNYKIIIWKQKADADADTPAELKYDFVESFLKSIPKGSVATIDEEYKRYAETRPEYAGYTCHWDPDADPVNPSGYTVLNVYYDREGDYVPSDRAHTLTFLDTADNSVLNAYNVAYQTSLLTGNEGGSFVPPDPARAHYSFLGWFADPLCSTQVFFSQAELDAYRGYNQTVLYDAMPDTDLTIYAGWEADWYLVQVDPNYGTFNGTGATWMWKTIESDLIQEYTQVTRAFVESSSGEFYYGKHDRAYYGYTGNEWDNSETDRDAFYTHDPGKATEFKTFEAAPDVYSYAGWYEVHADGTETPYDFTQHVDHDLLLRLHWKKAGIYYLRYLAGAGTLENSEKELTDPTYYADNAELILTVSAVAPAGWTFAGWRIQGDSGGTVYSLGQIVHMQSDFAVSVSGRETMSLEAVYVKLDTASITYDPNGGTVDPKTFDYGHPEENRAVTWYPETLTVSNLTNNSNYYLSNGAGLSLPNGTLVGWSNKPVYDENDPEAELYELGPADEAELAAKKGLYGVDSQEPLTLYAVWSFQVTYHLNPLSGEDPAAFHWGGDWTGYSGQTLAGEQVYTRTVYRGNPIEEPRDIPQYTGANSKMFRYWVAAPASNVAYGFSQPVLGALDLYAYWDGLIQVPVRVADASNQTLTELTGSEGWSISAIQAGPAEIPLPGTGLVSAPSDYTLAFVAAHPRDAAQLQAISREEEITAIYYNQRERRLYVRYAAADRADAVLDEDYDVFFVYYRQRPLSIRYVDMPASGELLNTSVTDDAPSGTVAALGEYDLTANLTGPRGWIGNDSARPYYAYAIGTAEATNASGLMMISPASNSDSDRPPLRVRNTWRGFEYSEDGGASWVSCGYDPTLFVVYFAQLPTVIMFSERTLGREAVADTPFSYHLIVRQTYTNVVRQRQNGADWEDVEALGSVELPIFDTHDSGNAPYVLRSGEANASILFYGGLTDGEQIGESFTDSGETYRYVATYHTLTSQTAQIEQLPNDAFFTTVEEDGSPYGDSASQYTYTNTSDGSGGTLRVVFTNAHKQVQVQVHLVRIENGRLALRDELLDAAALLDLPISIDPAEGAVDLLDRIRPGYFYKDENGVFAFGGAFFGTDDGNAGGATALIDGMGVEGLRYGQVQDNLYDVLLLDADGNTLGELGSRKLYYLYYPMPQVQYVKQEGDTLTLIQGSTDGLNPTASITYGGDLLTMNGQRVIQNQRLSLELSDFWISQAARSNSFKMPPILDDTVYQYYLSYHSLGVGPALASGGSLSLSALGGNLSAAREMHLSIRDNQLYWSFDGETWTPMGEDQTVYAIYTERGYDLMLTKVVDTDLSGPNPIFTDRQFTVTIQPTGGRSFKEASYQVEGYIQTSIPVEDGKLTLTVESGTKLKLLRLERGDYLITESNNSNFDLAVRSGPIVGGVTSPVPVTDSSATLNLHGETQAVLYNSPKAICEVVREEEEDGPLFYTLADAVNYVVNNIDGATATIALLSDYLMPAADRMMIPGGENITLTTATRGDQRYDGVGRAAITRSEGLTDASLVSVDGDLTLINVTLEGASLPASAPLIESTGHLIIQRGASLQNNINSGDGGAIYATGSLTLADDYEVNLRNNQARNGGLLYYAGTGTVTVTGGTLSGNQASQKGGAIYAVAGTLTISGGTLSGNQADQDGGAIYGENAVIELQGGEQTRANLTGNRAPNGSGGAVYAENGALRVEGTATVTGNSAAQNGGAFCLGTASFQMSGGSVASNTANGYGIENGGGAIFSRQGAVTVLGGSLSENRATYGTGGAVHAGSGAVTLSGGSITGNRAPSGSGGGIYAATGTVSISGTETSLQGNYTGVNGGAVWVGTGIASVTGGSFTGNTASSGLGGAIYADSGALTVTDALLGGTAEGQANKAVNGAAIFVNTGSAALKDGASITGNQATNGGAVGVGSESARLNLSGTLVIQNNTLAGAACNVYLDWDTDAIINTSGMSDGGYVGIYVPGEKTADLFRNRGDVGAEFGISSGSATSIGQFHNDREPNLKAVVNAITKRIYWSSPIKVNVRYLKNFASELPSGANGTSVYSSDNYYPGTGNSAISLLADELRSKCSNLSASSVYATALFSSGSTFDSYLTRLLWEDGKWKLEKRNGEKVDLGDQMIVIYYSEPTYYSIENNTLFELELSTLTVNLAKRDRSLLNSNEVTGFGLTYVLNGTIQEELLPVQANGEGKLVLPAGGSIIILIPGGALRGYSLKGSFVNGTGTVRLRRTGQADTEIQADSAIQLTGTTADKSSTHEIIFGENRAICKIWCPTQTNVVGTEYVSKYDYPDTDETHRGTTEYTFSGLQKAVAFARNHGLSSFTVQMLVDYLVPGIDVVLIDAADAFQAVTFTTAVSGYYRYPGTGPARRATISRGLGNENPLMDVTGTVGTSGAATETSVTLHDLNFDGKNLVGKCDGGALKTRDCKVHIYNVNAVNFTAYNGGAFFISFGEALLPDGASAMHYRFADNYISTNAILNVENVNISACTAKRVRERSGGGAIWSNAKVFSMTNCVFTNCLSDGKNMQGGAVFHRIEARCTDLAVTPYAPSSQSLFTNCTFTGCKAEAGGALESDATDIQVINCIFTNCSTTAKDGGAINVYIYQQDSGMNYNTVPSKLYLEGCTITGCTSKRNGGAVRSMAVDNAFVNCSFTNTSSSGTGNPDVPTDNRKGGGAIYVSNNRSVTTTVTGCSFTGTTCNKGPGGAICSYSKELVVTGTTFTNCTSVDNYGGAIFHSLTTAKYDGQYNNIGSYASLTDCDFTGCTAPLAGGGLYTNAFNARTAASTQPGTYNINAKATTVAEAVKFLDGCSFDSCRSGSNGGGVYMDSASLAYATVLSSTFKDCYAKGSGGGLYTKALNLTIGGTATDRSKFSGCSSDAESIPESVTDCGGGAVYHHRQDAVIDISFCTIEGCTSKKNGGGFFTTYAKTLNCTDCTVQNNTAAGSGGGIYNSTSAAFTLTDTTVSGNKSGGQGGGIYTKRYLNLVRSVIERNQLTTNTVENAAGVYIKENDGKLVLGSVGSSERDYSGVLNNTTQNGAASNMRLPENTGKTGSPNANCVTVNCDLGPVNGVGGYFGVVNAKFVKTQFGTSQTVNPMGFTAPDGFTVTDAVFHADINTLYGIVDRADITGTKIIWAGPPVCKITDEAGNLLYFKSNGSDPAIFDVLDDGKANGRSSAFATMRTNPEQEGTYYKLYYKDGTQPEDRTKYCIKMLVENYELTNTITMTRELTITLTTAGKDDKDGFPFERTASGTRANIYCGSGVTGSMIEATQSMKIRNIVLDGRRKNSDGEMVERAATPSGGIIHMSGSNSIKVELLQNAILQYGRANYGGGVRVDNGEFDLNGGLIRFCKATLNGGGVYTGSKINAFDDCGFYFQNGNIQQCEALNGGGVYVADGVFTMKNGSIGGCTASASGGGVYVNGRDLDLDLTDRTVMNMSGGFIGFDAPNHAGVKGGGIAVGGLGVRLNFANQVNVSKNTCDTSLATGKLCNLELNLDTKTIIHSKGLYSRSNIGVYVPGNRNDEDPILDTVPYLTRGGEGDAFGTFENSSAQLYCFLNDRNGLKGGLIANPAPDTIYWIKIFSIELSTLVETSQNIPTELQEAAKEQSFTFTINLWDSSENTSGTKVKDVAEDIAAAAAEHVDSKYGEIPFVKTASDTIITATVTLKHGETISAENLPAGLGYDVTMSWAEGYCNVPDGPNEPINYKKGKTGENKDRTDVNPYVSQVVFHNILPSCKLVASEGGGKLLYQNPVTSAVNSGEQMPAVYLDLNEALAAISGHQYFGGLNLSYNGNNGYRVEMLVPEYTVTQGQTLSTTKHVTLTTAGKSAADHFPFRGTGTAALKRSADFTDKSMLTLALDQHLTLTNIQLDGNKVVTAANGGLVSVLTGGTLTVTDGAELKNARVDADHDGAGIYLADGSHLNLSGRPSFGGADTDAFGYLYNQVGNFKVGDLIGQLNGGKNYTVAHQDIYLAESHENEPASIVLTGDLTGANGSIWVWADSEYHRKQLTPFARLADGVEGGNLLVFRNARNDEDSENGTDGYLYGVTRDGLTGYVCWNGIEGMAHVMLVKVKENSAAYQALAGKTFTVYKSNGQVAKGTVLDNTGAERSIDLENLVSGQGGAFFIGSLSYGSYYVLETGVPGRFEFTVDQGGVVMSVGTGAVKVTTKVKTVSLH